MTYLNGSGFQRVKTSALLSAAILLGSVSSYAGVDECNNLRVEEADGCEFRGDVGCSAGCDDLSMNVACSAELYVGCKGGCDLDVDVSCTGNCEAFCQQQCDAGEDITCTHNCFTECSGVCEDDCADAEDPDLCISSCEANCDGECDIRCEPLVDAPCYDHCQECCFGTCKAQINMECQIDCQAEAHAECEAEMRADCNASCGAEGAIFCDGEFVASGDDVTACAVALANEGIADLDLDGFIEVDTDAQGNAEADLDAESTASAGCSVSPGGPFGGAGALPLWSILGLAWAARRRAGRQSAFPKPRGI